MRRGHPKPNAPRPAPNAKERTENWKPTCSVYGCRNEPWHMGVCKSHYPTIPTDGIEWKVQQ